MTARPFVQMTRTRFWRIFYTKNSTHCAPDYYPTQHAAMTDAQRLAGKVNAWR